MENIIEQTAKRRQAQQVEKLMDEMTLPQMIELMSNICYEKGSHIRENWQDNNLAKLWDNNAKQLERIAPKLYS